MKYGVERGPREELQPLFKTGAIDVYFRKLRKGF
jgi:hypothetical protein